jgi:dTDP-glucose 4,6-dehydratase
MAMKTILVTGGAGFIGSNFLRYALDTTQHFYINVDKLTYAGNYETIASLEKVYPDRYEFWKADICDPVMMKMIIHDDFADNIDAIFHFAAESHVDRSVLGPTEFVRTNVVGTQNLLEVFRESLKRNPRPFRFMHISTDEVYGSLEHWDEPFREDTLLDPNSPYSASKAASDLLVHAYYTTYNIPAVVTRCGNNYGPYQLPEKLIPLAISRVLANQPIPLYGDGMNIREWIFVDDHVRALLSIYEGETHGFEVYNIGSGQETTNKYLLDILCDVLKERGYDPKIKYVTDRPGHDWRYAIDSTKLRRNFPWTEQYRLEEGLRETVRWYLDPHYMDWWKPLITKAHEAMRELYTK